MYSGLMVYEAARDLPLADAPDVSPLEPLLFALRPPQPSSVPHGRSHRVIM
jgi:hypothetical protein